MKRSFFVLAFLAAFIIGAYDSYAYYNPSTGRWLSRDPIKEKGFNVSSSYERSKIVDVNSTVDNVLAEYAKKVSLAVTRLNNAGMPGEAIMLQNAWNSMVINIRSHFQLIVLEDSYLFVQNSPVNSYDLLGLQMERTWCQDRCDKLLEQVCGDISKARRNCYLRCEDNPNYMPQLSDLIAVPDTKPGWPSWLDWIKIITDIFDKLKKT